MPSILITTSPARGHLYPIMDVALALRAAGFRVIVQTLADERERVELLGLEHRSLDPRVESASLLDYEAGNPLAQVRVAFDCWLARARPEAERLRELIDELDPDLLLVDANSWGASAVAEARGRPWAMFLPYCLPVPSRDAPAFGPGFAPPRTALGRLRDRAVWAIQRRAVRDPVAKLDTLRAELGLAPLLGFEQLFQRADVLLYRTAEPFEYPRSDWPANVRAIGPGLWAPPGDPPSWLAELPHPRVLVSVSTELQEDGAIIEAALEGLGSEPGSLIITTAALDPARFVAPNERVKITRFLPHAAVIPEVDVVVTHGGMGTTQRALASGVPVCVVPWGRDQSESARRAEVCGAGRTLSRSRLTPTRLRRAVRDAQSRAPAARAIARAFEQAGGAARGVELLSALL